MTYQEYKRRAIRIAGAEAWRVSEETLWLSQLGSIELHTDSNGRWSHVHATPLQLYPLPSLADGRYQFVIAGCGQISKLKQLVHVASELLDCEVRLTKQNCKILPPRLTFLHPEHMAGQQLAGELGIHWSSQAPAHQIASWAGTLHEWLETITWYPDPGPRASAEYSPVEFRFLQSEPFPAPWRLRQFLDPFTQQRWHCLYRPANAVHPEQHAYVRDCS